MLFSSMLHSGTSPAIAAVSAASCDHGNSGLHSNCMLTALACDYNEVSPHPWHIQLNALVLYNDLSSMMHTKLHFPNSVN